MFDMIRNPVGTPIANDNSGTAIDSSNWTLLGTLDSPASAMQLYNSSAKAIQVSDGAVAVHTITFGTTPDAGAVSFTFGLYGTTGSLTSAQGAANFQTLLDAIFGAGNTVVTGSFAAGFVIRYTGISGAISLPTVAANTLTTAAVAVVITRTSTIAGVTQTFLYTIPPTGVGSMVPAMLNNGGKLYGKAVGAAASTGFLTASFFG